MRAKMDPIIKQDMEASGFVILGISDGGFVRILAQSNPCEDLESIRASKVWIPEGDRSGADCFQGARDYTGCVTHIRCFYRLANGTNRNSRSQSNRGYSLSMAYQCLVYDRDPDIIPDRSASGAEKGV